MFGGIIFFFFLIVGLGMLLLGIAALLYGLYGMSVPGFDRTVRNFSLISGSLLIGTVLSLYFYSNNPSSDADKFYGHYSSVDNPNLKIQLLKDGTFKSDSQLTVKTTGTWRIIDFDEFYVIELLTENNLRLKSLDIIEKKEKIILTNKNHFTNVEDQLELIRQ